MKYLLAVSGGVDSVVLLDMLSRTEYKLIVAHVDHGIREDSVDDARFVEGLAKKYNLPIVMTSLELGHEASEEQARAGRYNFLFTQAEKFGATIVTAHHADDMVETIALNLSRGTGWRGLAVLNRQGVYRPLLARSKDQIYQYALTHRLEWVEDSTNHDHRYTRNKLRALINRDSSESRRESLGQLRAKQLQLAREIERESQRIITQHVGSRYFLTHCDQAVAIELLGAMIVAVGADRPPRPRVERALHAIKTAKPDSRYQLGGGVELVFTSRKFSIEVV